MGSSIGNRPLLLLGALCLILGAQSISTGFIGDLIVDATFRGRYNESHIKEVIEQGEGAVDISFEKNNPAD